VIKTARPTNPAAISACTVALRPYEKVAYAMMHTLYIMGSSSASCISSAGRSEED
jgi:hypothetical protein